MSHSKTMLDLPYSNISEYETFKDYFDINNEVISENISNYSNSDYDLNAANIQYISDITDDMQDVWDDNVLTELDNLKNLWQSWIDNISTKDKIVWHSGSTYQYNRGDIVKTSPDNGKFYLCLNDCDGSQALPTSGANTYWFATSDITGITGDKSYDLNFIGEFVWDVYNFNVNDIVYVISVDGVDFYVCTDGITYDSEISPSDDTLHWIFLFRVPRASLKIFDNEPVDELNNVFGVVNDNDEKIFDIEYITETLYLQTITKQVIKNGIRIDSYIKNFINEYNL